MTRPRLLDLFCGAGGAAMGYQRAGFDVVGVDHEPQPRFPFEFVQADALAHLARHGHEFAAIHASPPCQAYSTLAALNRRNGVKHPQLVEPARAALTRLGRPWVIENVPGAPLRAPIVLCGSAFGLAVRRHRLFESNVFLLAPGCHHKRQGRAVGVYGQRGSGSLRPRPRGGWFIRAKGTPEAQAAMGIDWMTWKELTQAIPPAYTELIGMQLIAAIRAGGTDAR